MRPSTARIAFILLCLVRLPLTAQEGTITFTAAAGASVLMFSEVDEDGRRDVEAYHRLGIPVGPYSPFRFGFAAEGGVEYRVDRDASLRLFGAWGRAASQASFADTSRNLRLDREITTFDIGLDIAYYLPPLVNGAEAALFAGVGRMVGRATQRTDQTHLQKSADTSILIIDQDAFAEYEKSKLYVRAGITLHWPLTGPLSLYGMALLKYAPLGTLDGTLRQFTLVRPHTTTVEFDFTTIDAKLGLSYRL